MKKGIVFIVALLAVFYSISLVSAIDVTLNEAPSYLSDVPNVRINSLRYEPYPVEPGEVFDLWIKAENMGSQQAKSAACRLILDNPFTLYQGDLMQEYGTLGSKDFVVFGYKLQVSENAVGGDNQLTIECTSDPGLNSWVRENVTIKVQTRYPTLNLANVKTDPEFIEPGQKAQLILTLKNTADSSMKDIDLKIDFSNVPLAPSGEMSQKKIRRLNAGDSEAITFNILALPTAEGGIYKVPITISYTDELGTAYSIDGTIAIEVNSKSDFYVTLESTTMTTDSKTGDAVLKIVNRGLTNVKFVTVKILPSKDVKIISADSVYIGDIDSNDFETADFRLKVGSDHAVLPLLIDYKDITNAEHQVQYNYTLSLVSPSDLKNGGGGWSIISIIIILAIAFVVYKKRKVILPKLKSMFKKN